MTEVAGKSRVNRPYFFTETDGSRMEIPAFGTGQGDLDGNQLAEFEMYQRAGQIELATVQAAPSNISAPGITGGSTATVGTSLTSSDGEWAGTPAPTMTRQWQRADVVAGPYTNISGATAASYMPVAADAGKFLRVTVTATNPQGSATESSAPTSAVRRAPSNTAAPVLSGTPEVGAALSVTNGTWVGTPTPTITRAWQRSANGTSGWTAISGATGTSHALTESDEGQYIRVAVTGTNAAGNATATSNAIGPVLAPEPPTEPEV